MLQPRGSIRDALMRAASECPGTLRELAQRSQVGYQSARDNVPKLAREGALRVVEARKVDYRNRLVHVYEVAQAADSASVAVGTDDGVQSLTELQRFIGAWRGESVT